MPRALTPLVSVLILALYSTAEASTPPKPSWQKRVNETLDALHDAAAKAQEERYFGLFRPDAVFVGTDATERWTMAQFRAYARPHFSRGKGWTYIPVSRHLMANAEGTFVWFDELLKNEKYGTVRGSGVVVLSGGRWQVAHYVLSFPIPNERAKAVVKLIQSHPVIK